MKKEKVILKDGTDLQIENGASERSITVIAGTWEEIGTIYGRLTEANLEEYKVLNADGLTCATLTNKYMRSANVSTVDAGYQLVFNIADVDMLAKQVAALQESQTIQDGAIGDLGTIVSEITEGGNV